VFNRLDHQTGISADRYPYTASSTELDSILPVWVYDGGVEKELERLKQPQICDKIIKELADQYPKDYWERIVILSVKTEKNKCWIGKRLSELMNNDIKPLIKLLIDEECMVDVLFFSMSEDNLQQILKKSYVVIGSDASSRATYGILAQSNVHPRAFGTFPRILKRYVKELQVLRLEEAIAKMTAMPAKILGITNRGIIQEDMFADIVIFDMNEICDTADYNSPLQYPTGIKYVILNGKVVLKNGVHSGIQSGKVLRRKS
jgi:N-acyl-D-amino-acid deacylase